MAKISELKAVVEGMTDGPWSSHNNNALNTWLVYPKNPRLLFEDKSLGPDEPRLYPLKETEGNAKGIAALRNHADALIELVEACISVLNQLDVVKNRYAIKELENALQKLENI